jgi:hypothetical protein
VTFSIPVSVYTLVVLLLGPSFQFTLNKIDEVPSKSTANPGKVVVRWAMPEHMLSEDVDVTLSNSESGECFWCGESNNTELRSVVLQKNKKLNPSGVILKDIVSMINVEWSLSLSLSLCVCVCVCLQ